MNLIITNLIPTIFLASTSIVLITIILLNKKENTTLVKNIETSVIFSLITTIFLAFNNFNSNLINYKNLTFICNKYTWSFQLLILIAALFFCLIIPKKSKEEENNLRFELFYIFFIYSIIGLLLLINSFDFLTIYLAIELHSIASYILAAYNKNSRKSTEAGLKYLTIGAIASGFLLFALSYLYGWLGVTNIYQLYLLLIGIENTQLTITYLFPTMMLIIAFLFKIGAVPYHLWLPDIYDGSPSFITAYFAIVPKISIIAILTHFLYIGLGNISELWKPIIIVSSIFSMLIGSIGALYQNSFKRFIAYAGISHLGYLFIGFIVFTPEAYSYLIIYLGITIISYIATFAFLLLFNTKDDNLKLSDLKGLGSNYPKESLFLSIALFSMAGIPPLAGFFGKYFLFLAALNTPYFYLTIIGFITSTISAAYYIRIIQYLFFYKPNLETQQTLLMNVEGGRTTSLTMSFYLSISFLFIFLFIPQELLSYTYSLSLFLF